MDDNSPCDVAAPCVVVQDSEVEGFRRNIESSEARADFYEPITHPFPPDPEPKPDELKVDETPGAGVTSDLLVCTSPSPPSLPSLQGDVDDGSDVAEPKRSISQEIIDVAYRTAREITSEAESLGDVREAPSSTAEIDAMKNASMKSLFNSLITSPSRVSSRMSRRDSGGLPAATEVEEGITTPQEVRPRYYSNRATTLPAKLECTVFDPTKHPKMTRWEILKRKFYLGVAHNMPPTRVIEDVAGMSLDAATPRASTAGPIDVDSFCEVTNIEGLDLEGIPPMTQRSRKLFSWTRLKTGFTFKRKGAKGAKTEEARPKGGEPDEAGTAQAHNTVDEEDEDDDICSQLDEEENATAKPPAKDKSHSWFEVLSHRLFTATRRQNRNVETGPVRPATAHPTQQYYEIESNW